MIVVENFAQTKICCNRDSENKMDFLFFWTAGDTKICRINLSYESCFRGVLRLKSIKKLILQSVDLHPPRMAKYVTGSDSINM